MSFGGEMSSPISRQEDRVLIRRRPEPTRSYGSYRPSAGDFVGSFRAVLERWRSETAFSSNPDEVTRHPSFRALVQNAFVATPLILSELRKAPSLLVWVLDDAYPGERPYPNSVVGNIRAMTEAWIAWGEQNGRVL